MVIYPFTYRRTSWLFSSLGIMNKGTINTCVQITIWAYFSNPLGKHQGAQLLDGMVHLICRTVKLYSKEVVWVCSLIKWEMSSCCFTSLQMVISVFWVLVTLTSMPLYLTVILICNSLVTYDVTHLFVGIYVNNIPFWVRYLFIGSLVLF